MDLNCLRKCCKFGFELLSQAVFNSIIKVRGGTGMKNKGGSGIGYQLNFNYGSGTGPRKTLPENTCITGEVIHRH